MRKIKRRGKPGASKEVAPDRYRTTLVLSQVVLSAAKLLWDILTK